MKGNSNFYFHELSRLSPLPRASRGPSRCCRFRRLHLGRGLGWIAYYVPPRLIGGWSCANLSIAFEGEKSPAELRRLARDHFATLGANLFSSFKLATMSPRGHRRPRQHREHGGAPQRRRARARASSWSSPTSAIGSCSPSLSRTARRDRRFGTIYQPLGNPHIDQHIKSVRARFGLVPFDRRRGFREPIKFLPGRRRVRPRRSACRAMAASGRRSLAGSPRPRLSPPRWPCAPAHRWSPSPFIPPAAPAGASWYPTRSRAIPRTPTG